MTKRTWKSFIGLFVSAASLSWGATGSAEIKSTGSGPLHGAVTLEDTPAGLHVIAALDHLPAGSHGFHIHEFGSCADAGKAAGSHYNPFSTPHGQVLKEGVHKAHAGDLGNITVTADGKATVDATIPDVTLSGAQNPVAGRAIIVHEKVDDFSQPAGNAGSRIGCGPIVITQGPTPPAPTK